LKGVVLKQATLYILLTFILLPAIHLSAVELDAETQARVEYLHAALSAMRNGDPVPAPADPEAYAHPGHKCGTPLVMEALHYHNKYGAALGFGDYFFRPSETEFPNTFDSPAGYFKIHYTTEQGARHQVNLDYGDGNSNGVPDYVEIVARIADSVWVHHVDELGYHEPLNDANYEWGGDSRYDIYLKNLSPSYYGITWSDGQLLGNGYQTTSFMELRNHYEVLPHYSEKPIDALQVTMAHEFFHAIHFWYDATEDVEETVEFKPNRFWLEVSAVWMEEETYDEVDDYYYYLREYMPFVHRSLRFWDNTSLYPYGAGIFAIYLSEAFDRDIIRTIWEKCGEVPGSNFLFGAIQEAIAEHSNGTRTFDDVFAEYARWLFFTGTRKPHFFEEGGNYMMIPDSDTLGVDIIRPYIRYVKQYPTEVTRDYSFFPNSLGINYIVFDVTAVDSGFSILDFKGVTSTPEPVGWRISVMGYNRFDPSIPVWVADSLYRNRDVIIVDNIEGFTDIVVVPVTTNPYYNKISNSYFFDVVGGTRDINEHTIHSPYPSPFELSKHTELRVPVDLAADAVAKMDVFTAAGEHLYSTEAEGVQNGQVVLRWDGRTEHEQEVASGVYVLLLQINGETDTRKVLVIR
jgi:hypothetical protein